MVASPKKLFRWNRKRVAQEYVVERIERKTQVFCHSDIMFTVIVSSVEVSAASTA